MLISLLYCPLALFSCIAEEQNFERTFGQGANATLPCFNLTLAQRDTDNVFVIFSYKNLSNEDFPQILRWRFKDGAFNYYNNDFEGKIQISASDGTLTIPNAAQSDSGEYRCELKSFVFDEPEIWTTNLAITNLVYKPSNNTTNNKNTTQQNVASSISKLNTAITLAIFCACVTLFVL